MKHSYRWCIAVVCALTVIGCGGGSSGKATVRGTATLRGEADHSAIVISLVGPVSHVVNAGADGSYAFDQLPAGTYAVTASAASTFEGAITVAVTAPAEGVATAPVVQLSPYGAISGTVTGGGAGTTVVVAGTSASGSTDAAGAYRIDRVPTGSHTVVASEGDKRGSASAVTVQYAQTASVPAFELSPATGSGSLAGQIQLGTETDRSGIVVTLSGPAAAAAVTDAAGTYSFGGLAAGEYLLILSAPSTAEGTQTARVTVSGATTAPAISFTPLGILAGTAQLAGASSGNAGILIYVPGYATFTDGAGGWSLRGVPTGTYEVRAFRAGYSSEVAAGQVVRYARSTAVPTLSLTASATASVTIASTFKLPAASDHSGISITVDGALTTTTDATGAFSLAGVSTGVHAISIDQGAGLYHRDLDAVLVLPSAELLIIDTATVPAQLLPFTGGLILSRGTQVVQAPSPAWPVVSPDGRYVLYLGDFSDSSGVLYLTDGDTGVTRKLTDRAFIAGYRFSQDGTHFAFAHEPAGTVGALSIGATAGGPLLQLSQSASPWALQEVPGGRLLYIDAPTDDVLPGFSVGTLMSVSWAGGDATPLGETVFAPAPDSFWLDRTHTRVALWSFWSGGDLSAVGVDGSNPTPLVPGAWRVEPLGGDTLGAWSGGVQEVLGDFSLANLATGGFGTAATNVNYPAIVALLQDQPDYRLLMTVPAYGGTYDVAAINLNDSTSVAVASNVANLGRIVFNGDWVGAFYDDDAATSSASLRFVNLATLTSSPVLTGVVGQVSFSGDRRKLAYADATQLYVAPVAGGSAPVAMGVASSEFSLSQDGAYLLWKGTNGSGTELDLTFVGGTTNQLVPGASETNGEFRGDHLFYYFYDPATGVRRDRVIRLGALNPYDLTTGSLAGFVLGGSRMLYVDSPDGSPVGTLKLFDSADDSFMTLGANVDGSAMLPMDPTHVMVVSNSTGFDPYYGDLHVVDLAARTIHQVATQGYAYKTQLLGDRLLVFSGEYFSPSTLEVTTFTGTPRTTLAAAARDCVVAPSQAALTCLTFKPAPTVEWIRVDGSARRTLLANVPESQTIYLPPGSDVIELAHQVPNEPSWAMVANAETGNAFGLTGGDTVVTPLSSNLLYFRPSVPGGYPFEAGAYVTPRP